MAVQDPIKMEIKPELNPDHEQSLGNIDVI